MLNGVGKNGPVVPTPSADSPIITGGASGPGGLLNDQKDAKEASTEAKFGDLWKQIQSKYGAKPEKPREIKKTLDKDDFLKIMVTQMKHQDPTNPFKAEQFAAEMAQFTTVEQLHNLNSGMTKLTTANQPLEKLAMTGLIGKTVTVDRERFPHTEGQNEALTYVLPKDAKEVHIAVISDAGETVFEKDMGAQKQGENTFSWDGLKKNTLPSKTGAYMFRVMAKDDRGQSIAMSPNTQARVIGVSFEGQEPVFLIGSAANPTKVTMKNIVKIDDDSGGNTIPGAQPLSAQPEKKPNFIAFQKGVGSSNLNSPEAMPPEVVEALKKYEEAQKGSDPASASVNGNSNAGQMLPGTQNSNTDQVSLAARAREQSLAQLQAKAKAEEEAARSHESAGKSDEKGFPNGLHDGEESVTIKRGGEGK